MSYCRQMKTCANILIGFLVMTLGSANRVLSDEWIGGGPGGANIISMSMCQDYPDVVYAGAEEGALFKTTDGGVTWARTGFPEWGDIITVEVHPRNPDTVYVGTDGSGIRRSIDGGDTWDLLGLDFARKVNDIAIDPTNPNVMYAATGEEEVLSPDSVGVFKSVDGGLTWDIKYSTIDMRIVWSLLIDSDNPSRIYAGLKDGGGWNDEGWNWSTDGGETWDALDFTPGSYEHCQVKYMAMTASGHNPATIYASLFDYGGGLYKSIDRGLTWTKTNHPFSSASPVAVDPNDGNLVYCRRHKSTDAGETWSEMENGLSASGYPTSILIDPQNSNVYMGMWIAGVFKSIDRGETWQQLNLGSTAIAGLAVHPINPDTVFASIRGQGGPLVWSENGGHTWQEVDSLPTTNLGAVAFDLSPPYTLWVGDGEKRTDDFYVYRSADLGASWQGMCFLSYIGGWDYSQVTDIIVSPLNSDHVLVGSDFKLLDDIIYGDGVLARTIDGGINWQGIGWHVTALAIDPSDPNIIYHGTRRLGYVFRYPNVWGSSVSSDITPSSWGDWVDVRDIAVDRNSKTYVATNQGLWKWDGSLWDEVTSFPALDVTALAIDTTPTGGAIYTGTMYDGIYVSDNDGIEWVSWNTGLGSLSISILSISGGEPGQSLVYAGTNSAGVWSRHTKMPNDLSDACTDQMPSEYKLAQNYPNPFNPTTRIEYTIKKRTQVTLAIHNLLGQEVVTIIDEIKPAGQYSVVWDGRNRDGQIVPTGIYFYQLKADDYVQTKKMLLLK